MTAARSVVASAPAFRSEAVMLQLPQLHSVEGHPELQLIRRRATDTGRVVGESEANETSIGRSAMGCCRSSTNRPEAV